MRSNQEFNWTPIPALYVYCAYRIDENAINNRDLRDKFSDLFNVTKKRTIESKISNYRYLSGEGRGLKNGAKIAEIINDQFTPIDLVQLETIYNGLSNQRKLPGPLRDLIISITIKWLKDMPLSKANRYLRLAIGHGLSIEGYEATFEDLLSVKLKEKKKITLKEVDPFDLDYQNEINQTHVPYFNPNERRTPRKITGSSSWYRCPRLALKSLEDANFKCLISAQHKTFTNNTNSRPYMEVHHLIPISYQDKFKVNLDCPENIVILCPKCHRQVHHAIKSERTPILKDLFERKKRELKEVGIKIKLSDLYALYI